MPVLVIGGVELVAVVVALAALVAVLALWVLFRPVTWLLEQAVYPVDAVGSAINGALKDAMRFFIGIFDGLAHGVAHFFYMLAVGTWHLLYQLINTILDAKTWAVRAYNAAVAGTAAAEAAATSLFNTAEADIATAATGVLHDAENLFNRAEADIGTAVAAGVATAEAFAFTEAENAIHVAEHLYNVAVADITSVKDLLNGEIDSVLSKAEAGIATAEAQIAALGADIVNTGARVLTEAEQYTDAALAGLGVLGIAGELASVLSRVGVLEAEATTCLKPLCDTVTPQAGRLGNLGKLFQGLENLAVEGLIFALAAEAVHDPGAVATDISTVVDDVGGVVLTGYRDLIGV